MSKGFGILVVVVALLCAPALVAQSGTGNITGRVSDPTGAVIPGAKVVATNVDNGAIKVAVTNSAGVYELQELSLGHYSLEATAPNFKTFVRQGITLQVEDNLGIDLKLEIGSATETISVQSDVSGLRKEDAQTGEVVTNELIENIPNFTNGNTRDPLALINIAGNVQSTSGGRAGLSLGLGGVGNVPDTRINGGRTQAIEYYVDGVPATEGFVHNVVNTTPTTEDIAEFKVVTNGLSAEYGRLSGGAVSIATKAGTNDFHGNIFEYHQDAFLNANSTANTSLTPIASKANFRQNDFGVAMGGPVLLPHFYNGKNKTFWFANYEGLRNSSSGDTEIGQTITDAERTGDLTDIGLSANDPNYPWAQVYDPNLNSYPNQVLDPQTKNLTYERYLAGGDGRHIPQPEINPLIAAYIALAPHPNHQPVAGGTIGNYIVRQPNTITQDTWSVRLDEILSDKSNVYARFTYNTGANYTGAYNPVLGTYFTNSVKGGYGLTIHYNHAFSPTTLLDLHVGGNYNPFDTGNHLPNGFDNSKLGLGSDILALVGNNNIANVHNGPFTEGQGYGGSLVDSGQLFPLFQAATFQNVNSTTYDYAGSLTKILGRHSLKFGYEGRRYFDNPLSSAQDNQSNPGDGFAFDASGVTGPYLDQNNTWGSQGYANGLGQFLLGIDTWSRFTGAVGRSLAQNYYASYVQDDFKVNSRLVLNLGFRWEMQTPISERNNNLSVWDSNAPAPFTVAPGYSFNAALIAAGLDPALVRTPSWVSSGFPNGNLVLVGTPEHPSRLATNYKPWNFAPRLGFAYQINPKTVVRGSFAFLYLPTSGNLTSYGDAPGVSYSTQYNNQNTQSTNAQGLPGLGLQTVSAPFNPSQHFTFQHNTYVADQQTAQTGNGTGGIDINTRMPREYDWGLSVQREFPGGWILELQYNANNSSTLLGVGNPSRFPADLHTGGPNGLNAKIYSTNVQSPLGQQVPCFLGGCTVGPNMNLGILEYAYPYYGPATIEGTNNGKSNYESGTVRVEHRFKSGLYTLFNYTYSKSLDDVGGADSGLGNPGSANGTGGKPFQLVYDQNSVYGLSGFDRAHILGLTYIYDFPLGRGRRWMSDTQGIGGAILQGAVGGWSLSGHSAWYSGTPINISPQGSNVDQTSVYDWVTFISLAHGATIPDLFNKNFKGPRSVRVYPGNPAKPQSVSAFNLSALDNGQGGAINGNSNPGSVTSFTNGNLPTEIGIFRNPGNWTTDISLLKQFPFNKDGGRYFQLRLEGLNIFNHPGYGGYDSSTGDQTFGQVTSVANGPRTIQVGGRVVF